MRIPLRPCPFCGALPTLEYLPDAEVGEQEYLLQHATGPVRCIGSDLCVLAASPEACAQRWNARSAVEYQWTSVLDTLAVALLNGKPEVARLAMRKAINRDVGSDEDALADYWHCWLTDTPITTQEPTPITIPDLFTQPAR